MDLCVVFGNIASDQYADVLSDMRGRGLSPEVIVIDRQYADERLFMRQAAREIYRDSTDVEFYDHVEELSRRYLKATLGAGGLTRVAGYVMHEHDTRSGAWDWLTDRFNDTVFIFSVSHSNGNGYIN